MSTMTLMMQFVLADLASAGAKRIADSIRGAGKAGQAAAAEFDKMGERIAAGVKAAALASELKAALVDPGVAAAAEIDAALRRLQVELDAGPAEQIADELARARAEADRIQASTRFGSTDVLEIVTGLKKSGFKMSDILGQGAGAEAAAFLATADTSLSPERASGGVALLATKFGLAGDQLVNAADLLVRYGSAANTDAGQLIDALGNLNGAGELGLTPQDTLALLGALANTGKGGGEGGTAAGAFLRQLVQLEKNTGGRLSAFNKQGQFKGLDAIAAELHDATGKMTEEKRQRFAQQVFGDEGKAAFFALLKSGDKSLEAVNAAASAATGLADRVDVIAGGLDASVASLQGTMQSTLATLFQPAVDPLARGAQALNSAAADLGAAAAENPDIARGVTGVALGSVAAAGAVAAAQVARGGWSGLKGLRALGGGLGGVAGGIGAGKVAEEVAGVTPVYVVNWPATLGLGGAADAAGAAGKAGGLAGKLGKAGVVGGLLAGGITGGIGLGNAINNNGVLDAAKDNVVYNLLGPLAGVQRLLGGRGGAAFADAVDQERIGSSRRLVNELKLNLHIEGDRATATAEGLDAVDTRVTRRDR